MVKCGFLEYALLQIGGGLSISSIQGCRFTEVGDFPITFIGVNNPYWLMFIPFRYGNKNVDLK